MIDLVEAVAQYYRDARPAARGDELALHVGDLPGCDRAAWSRINGLPQAVAPFQTRVGWDMGHAYEAEIRKALEWWAPRNGFSVVHGGVIALGLSNDRLVAFPVPTPFRDDPGVLAQWAISERVILGHPDFMLEDEANTRYVVDTKWSGRFPKSGEIMPYDYRLKTAAYAFAVAAEYFTPFVYYGTKKKFDFDWEPTGNYIGDIENRVRDLIALYDREDAPPEDPPTHYAFDLCGYCDALDCGRNKTRGAA